MAGSTGISEYLNAVAKRVESAATARVAADAMAETLEQVASRYVGGDLSMSRAGRIVITPEATGGKAAVATAGAYGLADKGRRVAKPAKARGHGLATPWGPRMSVKGSTWPGFGISAKADRDVYEAGIDAVIKSIES